MTTLTLIVRASSPKHVQLIDEQLKVEFENLDLEYEVAMNPTRKWVQITLSGEDEVIATSYINKEIGTCPINLESIERFSVLKGFITKVDLTKEELRVDVGIFAPKIVQATIPVANLQAQLVEGRNLDLKKISELFGFQENLPLSVRVTDVSVVENDALPAELSAEQAEKLRSWQESLLDRLIILSSSRAEVDEVIERTNLGRDIIGVEALGFFEHALTCKLGTEAAGLIPRIGRYMRYAKFIVFNPRKNLALLSVNCH